MKNDSNHAASERQRELAMGALMNSRSLEEAAKKIGRSRRTLSRWMEDPNFRDAYQQLKRDMLRAAIGSLTAKAGRAVHVLVEVAEQKGRPYQAARAHAAAAILKLALDASVIDDLTVRIERLEAQRTDPDNAGRIM